MVTDYLYDDQGLPVEQVTTTGTNYAQGDIEKEASFVPSRRAPS